MISISTALQAMRISVFKSKKAMEDL